jgi:Flp pilus assembly pilin Flp
MTSRQRFGTFVRSEAGPTSSEYAVMLAMIILVSMGIIGSIGDRFQGIYLAIAGRIPGT